MPTGRGNEDISEAKQAAGLPRQVHATGSGPHTREFGPRDPPSGMAHGKASATAHHETHVAPTPLPWHSSHGPPLSPSDYWGAPFRGQHVPCLAPPSYPPPTIGMPPESATMHGPTALSFEPHRIPVRTISETNGADHLCLLCSLYISVVLCAHNLAGAAGAPEIRASTQYPDAGRSILDSLR